MAISQFLYCELLQQEKNYSSSKLSFEATVFEGIFPLLGEIKI